MVLGIGNDIIEVERVQDLFESHTERFAEKLLTPKENLEFEKRKKDILYLAGRFSAKEAIVKALGTGFGKTVGFHDIEILNDAQGKPNVTFSPALQAKLPGVKVLLSISHCKSYATAFAVRIS